MKIGVLTSSRADFGIYLPLLKALKADSFFELKIIAFGTHLSYYNGRTIDDISAQGFHVSYTLETMLLTDTPASLSSAMGLGFIKFGDFWAIHARDFDLVFCLGDRYEMYAAVMAGVPSQIPFAHIHGGETTLGAIDNIFRHGITLASKYHFVATESYANRVKELVGTNQKIYHSGSLSLDNLSQVKLLTIQEFKNKWGIDLSRPTVLTTFHPETVDFKENETHTDELIAAIHNLLDYQFLITMPNTDTAGTLVRNKLKDNFSQSSRVVLIENLGSVSYFTAMSYCSFLLGNTSSGIIEAASFGKYVINVGSRQKGRAHGDNVVSVPAKKSAIIDAVQQIELSAKLNNDNMYFKEGAANFIIDTLKKINNV